MLMSKIIDQWRHLSEDDTEVTLSSQWIRLFKDGAQDPDFILQYSCDFTPSYMHQHHLTMSLFIECLSEWENPFDEVVTFFHTFKIIRTTKWPKKQGITFIYGKMATLG